MNAMDLVGCHSYFELSPYISFHEPPKTKMYLLYLHFFKFKYMYILSYDVASGSEITPCNKNDKPLVVYRFTGNVMTSITTLRT